MHHVYSTASLTIVAASGDNPDTGLSGLNPGSRYVQQLDGVVDAIGLVQRERTLHMSIDSTIRNKRAW
jgi:hypothetical protein